MYPILVEWGDFVLPAWHTFFALAACSAYLYLQFLRKRFCTEVSERDVSHLFIYGYLGGYFGARLLSIIIEERHDTLINAVLSVFQLGAMTYYGGLIGGFLAALVFVIVRKLPPFKLADICVPAGLVGLAIGRLGCFLNGDDYGAVVSDAWWAVSFPNHQDPQPRIPTQLLETFVVSGIVGFAYLKAADSRVSGLLGCYATMAYGVYRFLAEYLRDDPRGWVIDEVLSPSQLISVILVVCLIPVVVKLKERS